ncbi:MAG: flagellar basal body P-ring formation chaperone FlgA [Xanthobacteraceae bacterium]
MTRRFLLLIFWPCVLIAAANAADRLADVPRIKPFVIVVGDLVRIGDVLDNAGAVADVAIFRSPDVGSTGTVPTADVLKAVAQHDLLLIDASGIEQVEITRASRVVSRADIERRIARALSGQPGLNDPDKLTVTFDREPRPLYLESSAQSDLDVTRTGYDPRTSRFDVTLSVPGSAAARGMPLRFTGTIRETVEVPMLNRAVARGEVIKESDVSIERKARADVPPDAVVAPNTIVGLAARQPLRPGTSLRRTELVRPELVKRDETVTIVYEVPGIMLTSRGKAIEGGADGDVINVLNTQSKRTVQGTVSGPGRVTIAPATPINIVNAAAVTPGEISGQREYQK